MKSTLLAVAVVALVVLVAALASPLLGLQSLRDSLAQRDEANLLSAVDMDRLRASLSARVRARYSQTDIKLPIEPVIERLITPQGLISAICDGGVTVVGGPQPRPCDIHGALEYVRFESPDRFSAALTQNSRIAATVVLDRVGLRWQLVDLVLPSSAYEQIKNSVSN